MKSKFNVEFDVVTLKEKYKSKCNDKDLDDTSVENLHSFKRTLILLF